MQEVNLSKLNDWLRKGPDKLGLFLDLAGVSKARTTSVWYMLSSYAGAMEILEGRGYIVSKELIGIDARGMALYGTIGKNQFGTRRICKFTMTKSLLIRMEVYKASFPNRQLDPFGNPLFSIEHLSDEFLMEVLAGVAISDNYLLKKKWNQ